LTSLPDVPLVVISSGDQPSDTIAEQRQLLRFSPQSRHIIASNSGHWIQFDEPDLVISTIRDVVDRARGRNAA
jgi:pimeloyl-ACP methyl ester carboxylesterase